MLPAGEYNVKLNGTNAVFTSASHYQKFTAPTRIDNAPSKHASTAVVTRRQDGTERMQAIELGGSTTTLEFNN
jgi:hypothetical protein